MKLQPLQNNILAEIHEGRKSDLHIPDNSAGLQPYAEIMAVGPDVKTLTVGQRVLFSPNSVFYVEETKGKKFVLISEQAVFALYLDEEPIPFS